VVRDDHVLLLLHTLLRRAQPRRLGLLLLAQNLAHARRRALGKNRLRVLRHVLLQDLVHGVAKAHCLEHLLVAFAVGHAAIVNVSAVAEVALVLRLDAFVIVLIRVIVAPAGVTLRLLLRVRRLVVQLGLEVRRLDQLLIVAGRCSRSGCLSLLRHGGPTAISNSNGNCTFARPTDSLPATMSLTILKTLKWNKDSRKRFEF
jgi:hypothetical protein